MPLTLNEEKAYALAPKPCFDTDADWGPIRQIDPEEIKHVVYSGKFTNLADSFPTFDERKAGTVTEVHRNFESQVSFLITHIKEIMKNAGIVQINNGDIAYGTADAILDQFYNDMLFPFIETDEEATKNSKLSNQPDEIFTAIKVYLEEVLYIYFSDQTPSTQRGHARLCRRIHQLLINIFACGPGIYSYLQTTRDDLLDARTNYSTLETALPHIVDNLRARVIDRHAEGFCARYQVPPQEEIHIGIFFKNLALKYGIHVPGEYTRNALVDPIITKFLEAPESIGKDRDNFYKLSSDDIPVFIEHFCLTFTPFHIAEVVAEIIHAKLAKVFGSHLSSQSVSTENLMPVVTEIEQFLDVTEIAPLLFEADPNKDDHYRFSLHIYEYLRNIIISQLQILGYINGITYTKIQGTDLYLASDQNKQPESAWLCKMDEQGTYKIVNHVDAIEAIAAKENGMRIINWLIWATRAFTLLTGFEDNPNINGLIDGRKEDINRTVLSNVTQTGTITGIVILSMEDIYQVATQLIELTITDDQKIFQFRTILSSLLPRRYLLELYDKDTSHSFTKTLDLIHIHFSDTGIEPLSVIAVLEATAAHLYGNLSDRYQSDSAVLDNIPRRLLPYVPIREIAAILTSADQYFDYADKILGAQPMQFLSGLLSDLEEDEIPHSFGKLPETISDAFINNVLKLTIHMQHNPPESLVEIVKEILSTCNLHIEQYQAIMRLNADLLRQLHLFPLNVHLREFLTPAFNSATFNPLVYKPFVECHAIDCFHEHSLNAGFYRKYCELNEDGQEFVFNSLINRADTQYSDDPYIRDATLFYKALVGSSRTLDELATVKFIPDRFVSLVSDKAHTLLRTMPIVNTPGFVKNFRRFPTPIYFTKAFVFFGREMHETLSIMQVNSLPPNQIEWLLDVMTDLCDTEQHIYDLLNDLPVCYWDKILGALGLYHVDISADAFQWLEPDNEISNLQRNVIDIVNLYERDKSSYRKYADSIHFSYGRHSSSMEDLISRINTENGIQHAEAKSIIARKLANEIMRMKGSPRAPLTHTTAAILRRR